MGCFFAGAFLTGAVAAEVVEAGAGKKSTRPPYEVPQQFAVEFVNHHLRGMFVAAFSDVNKRRAEWGQRGAGDTVTWIRNGSVCYHVFMPSKPGERGTYTSGMGSFHNTPLNLIFPVGTWEKIGTEKVGGVLADKYRLTNIRNQHKNIVGTYWIDPATRVPIRFTVAPEKGGRRNVFERTRFEIGPQADVLFRPPAGYVRK